MNDIRVSDDRVATHPRTGIATCVLATVISACLLPGCNRDEAAHREREIQRLTTTIQALEKRIDSGEYPNLDESLKRQLEARRKELAELKAARDEAGDSSRE